MFNEKHWGTCSAQGHVIISCRSDSGALENFFFRTSLLFSLSEKKELCVMCAHTIPLKPPPSFHSLEITTTRSLFYLIKYQNEVQERNKLVSHADRKQTNWEKQGLLFRNKMLRTDGGTGKVSCRFKFTLSGESNKNWPGKEHMAKVILYWLMQNFNPVRRASWERPKWRRVNKKG